MAEAAKLARLAQHSAPAEAFGLLGARLTARGVRLYLLPLDARASPTGFRVTLSELTTGRHELGRRGLLLAGCFHTHPSGRAVPSDLDRASMRRFPMWWLIYAPRQRRVTIARLRAGLLERGRLYLARYEPVGPCPVSSHGAWQELAAGAGGSGARRVGGAGAC